MTTPLLELPEVPESLRDAADEINGGFWRLDGIVQLSVRDKDRVGAPSDAIQGDRYIIPASGAQAEWAAHPRKIAYLGPEGWIYIPPRPGWRAYVADEDTDYRYTGTEWVEIVFQAPDNLTEVLTTAGDLLTMAPEGSPPALAYTRVPVGLDGQVLAADSSVATGLRWRYPGAGGGSVPLPEDARVNYMRLRFSFNTGATPAEVTDGPSWSTTAATNVLVAAAASATPLLANGHRRIRTNAAATGFCATYTNSTSTGPRVTASYANASGFTFQFIGGIDSLMSDGTSAFRLGLEGATGVPSNVNPSTLTNLLCLGADNTDTNAQWMHNDGAGSATKIDLGITKASLVGKLLLMTISVPVGGGDVTFSLYVVDDDVTYTATASTNLPAIDQVIIPRFFANDTINAETAGIIIIDVLLTWQYGVPAGV